MSETPYSDHFDDIYFAVEDGLAESRYIFLEKNNLPAAWKDKEKFVIAETGFGTGLNFLCAWTSFETTTQPSQHLHYYSFEKYPLSRDEIQKYLMHWSSEFNGRLEKLIAEYPLRIGGWHTLRLTPKITLTIIFDDVNRALPQLTTSVNCWFLDGHAPSKNPDMWSETVFHNIGRLSHEGTRFATFTSAGIVRRGLQNVGFSVSKTKGFGTKKEMSVGVYEQKRRPAFSKLKPQHIAIIGGGIAGAAMSSALSERGCIVTLFEKRALASGGSGNDRGLCNPRISAHRGNEADFYSPAFMMAARQLKSLSEKHNIDLMACGSLHLLSDEAKAKRYNSFIDHWGWHSEHAKIITAHEASEIAGVPLLQECLYMPDSITISPRKATEYLAQSANIIIKDIRFFQQIGEKWLVDDTEFDVVILCGGYDVTGFKETKNLPLEKIRGQVTKIKTSPLFDQLKANLCYGGYSSVPENGETIIGSTFQKWLEDDTLLEEDHMDNINKLKEVAPHLAEGITPIGGRASFRCAAKDRAPLIGQIHDCHNLYISTAHGSHGIISSIMGAEYLASKICGEHQILPQSTEKFLSPSRFKRF